MHASSLSSGDSSSNAWSQQPSANSVTTLHFAVLQHLLLVRPHATAADSNAVVRGAPVTLLLRLTHKLSEVHRLQMESTV